MNTKVLRAEKDRAGLIRFIGRPVDQLTLPERLALAGKWVAMELYTPQTLPLRTIEALARSAPECIEQLQSRNLDPANFEFQMLRRPY